MLIGVPSEDMGCIASDKALLYARLTHTKLTLCFLPQLIGTPSEEDMGFITSDKAKRYLRSLEACAPTDLHKLWPDCNAQAVDLIAKMLVFNPRRRITGEKERSCFRMAVLAFCLVALLCIAATRRRWNGSPRCQYSTCGSASRVRSSSCLCIAFSALLPLQCAGGGTFC